MMFRGLFTSKEARTEALFGQLVFQIASQMPQASDLPARLEALANAVAELPELAGAMVVACDGEGFPICYRGSGVSVSSDAQPFAELTEIRTQCLAAVQEGNEWTQVRSGSIKAPGASTVVARLLNGGNGESLRGMLLVGFPGGGKLGSPGWSALLRALEHVRWAVWDALRLEQMQCVANLHRLAGEELGKAQLTIQPQNIAARLRTVFRAEAVTILVEEEGKLYLSATTDDELKKTVHPFDPRLGLTGRIFTNGTSLRLRNANVPEEVRSLGEIKVQKARHLEALAKDKVPFRLLAVPLRADDKTGGVIRILRRAEKAPFSAEEEVALQQFADLLGAVIAASWQLFLDRQIREARSEAFCISRHERRKGESIPKFVYVNRGAEELFGLGRAQIIGQNAPDLYADKEYEKIRKLLEKVIRAGDNECSPVKSRVKGPEGKIRSVDISFRLLTSPYVQPVVHYAIGVVRDITAARLRAEQHQRLLALLEKKGLAYFLTDAESRTIESTMTDSRLTGYPPEELLGKRREDLYDDSRDRKRLLENANKRDGQLAHSIERLRRKDGTPFFVEGVIHVLKDDEGRKVGYEGLYEDVTERIRLQGFLDADTGRVLREHELLDKLRDNASFHLNFVTSLSHQLRAPLGAMVHNLLNLQEGIVGQDARFDRRLEYIIGQANVCSMLVQNLAFMDKILRGESFLFRPINLTKLAIQTKLDFKHLLPEKKLSIEVDDASLDRLRKDVELCGHEDLLRQVLVNLVDNALKYSQPGTQIRMRGFSAGPQGRAFEITNHGLRISGEDRKHIFSRGFRSQQAAAWVPAGSGLGLWLVRKIVEAHGATVRCTEVVEAGEERTTFRIFFPHKALQRSVNAGGSHEVQSKDSPRRR